MNPALKILIVEDVPADRDLAEQELKRSGMEFTLLWVQTAEEFVAGLKDFVPDIVLSDYSLPQFDGMRALRLTIEHAPGTAFIMLTGSTNEETAVECMKAGADDYVLKDHIRRLATAVTAAVEKRRLRVERKRAAVLAMRDSVAREQAEEALRRSEEKYRNLFQDNLTGNFIMSPDGTILECNPAFARMFGFASPEELVGTPGMELYADAAQRSAFLEQLRKEKRLEYLEGEFKRKDGSALHTVGTIVGIFDAAGTLTQIRGYLFDDTRRKTLEKQLLQAQKLESIGTLAGGIAHDFNNILGIILGHISFLDPSQTNPVMAANSIEAITKATQRGAGLVRQILTFARKSDVALAPMSINGAVEDVSRMLRETLPKNISIVMDLAKDLPAVTMDHTQMHQALLNLCVNSRDAIMDSDSDTERKGTITIATRRAVGADLRGRFSGATARCYVGIAVSDTGSGFDEETKNHLFEPFFTTKAQGKGTGLGLSVVYGVVHGHGGFIDVESRAGKGTTFTLWFPESPPLASTQTVAREAESAVSGGTETILFVEDEESLLSMMMMVLEDRGYKVLPARDGMEAIRLFNEKRKKIDLVISDLGLPTLDGVGVFTMLRELDPRSKIILVTGYLDPEIKTRLDAAGAKDYLQKPYIPTEMLRKIREVIERK